MQMFTRDSLFLTLCLPLSLSLRPISTFKMTSWHETYLKFTIMLYLFSVPYVTECLIDNA